MKREKIIHCRLTREEHEQITKAAKEAGLSITKYVVQAALGKS